MANIPSGPTVPQVRITNFVLTSVATIVTFFRLFERAREGRLWWDDAWAALTVVFMIIFMAAVEIHVQDPSKHSHNVKIAAYYMCAQFFYAVAWSARISILFTVIRLAVGRLRKLVVYAAGVFLLVWAILFAQVWWVCEREPGWKDAPLPQCDLGLNVAVAQVITDVLCDAFLISVPFKLVWGTKLTRAQKIRIIAIFSTTFITTGVSLNHAYFVLRVGGLSEALAAIIQDAISLIVANLSVVIAFLFRIGTEEPHAVPSFKTRSIVTFGQLGRRQRVPVTTTFITTETTVHDGTNVIDLEMIGSQSKFKSQIETNPSETRLGEVDLEALSEKGKL